MNKKLILKVLGAIMVIEAALLLVPMVVAFIYGESDWKYFLYTIIGSLAVGLPVYNLKCEKKNMHALDGYLVVALAWIVLSAIAAVPLCISGYIPNYLNAIFETVSGFTTSGVTAMPDVEVLSYSMQFWRIMTHWVGGMGILVFMLAITPVAGGGSAMHMMRAESPGPTTEKISPKISTTAKYLYIIYFAFTVAEVIALMISGISLYHSILIAFGTMATGGFSYSNASLAMLTMAQRNIVTVFMFLAGVNFSLFFLMATGKFKTAIKNEELRWYAIIYVGLCVVLTLSVYFSNNFETVGEAIHHVAFMVASLMTTTGYSSCNFEAWPWFAKHLMLLFMFVGACAGSTAGGIKVCRIDIMVKSMKDSIHNLIHPRSVSTVRFNNKEVAADVIRGVRFYMCLFVVIYAVSMIIVCLDPRGDFITAFSAIDTTINNNGIAFGGANGSFYEFTWYSKVVFIIDMLIGRLEIFPIIILLNRMVSPLMNGGRKVVKRLKRHSV